MRVQESEAHSQATFHDLRTSLKEKLDEVKKSILSYPPPIPACDAQFNYLLEQRDDLPRELARLAKLENENLPEAERLEALQCFVQNCPYLERARSV